MHDAAICSPTQIVFMDCVFIYEFEERSGRVKGARKPSEALQVALAFVLSLNLKAMLLLRNRECGDMLGA
ncbi:hypothetical protein E2542_SST31253 [Spatholobus suberectus]|nr:hypothetical protein E2542_SST31253 [Spatholobus suberectus]